MLKPTSVLWLLCLGTASNAGVLDDYMLLRVGSFSSEVQAAQDERYDVATWHTAEIWSDNDPDTRWLYVESWIDEAPAPYMQRVAKLVLRDDGTVQERRFRLADAGRVLGAWLSPDKFDDISVDGLSELKGCESIITPAGIGRFESTTTGKNCRNGYKGAQYAISRSIVTQDGMTNWDRGFDADGRLVWGPEFGGYRFTRSDADRSCSKPVRMLVFGAISDRRKFIDYVVAIGRSGLYEEANGYYEALTPALEVFEGEPPANRAVLIARFPCLEKARDFWYSDTYAEIRKIREGVAEFEVLVLPAPPLPTYLRQ